MTTEPRTETTCPMCLRAQEIEPPQALMQREHLCATHLDLIDRFMAAIVPALRQVAGVDATTEAA